MIRIVPSINFLQIVGFVSIASLTGILFLCQLFYKIVDTLLGLKVETGLCVGPHEHEIAVGLFESNGKDAQIRS